MWELALAAMVTLGCTALIVGLAHRRRALRHREEEAREAAAALRQRERHLTQLFEQAPVGFFEAISDGLVVRANRAMHLILGRAPGTLPGFNVADLGWGEEGTTREPAEAGTGDRRAVRYRHPDGSERDLELRANPILDDEGRPAGTLTAVMDVTERNRAERERQELARRMEQTQRLETIGTLAGGIAHDMNNLLTPILGYVEIALAEMDPESVFHEDLMQVAGAANRAKELVAQILRFSRPEKDDLSPVLLQSVAREVTGLLRASLPTTIRIDHRVDSACPPVLGKATQIHQILFNLCTNASHAMPDGGTITVSIDLVDALATLDAGQRPEGEGPFVRLRVQDDGTGMDEATAARVFQPFFTTKEPGKGTGLGLSVVQGIVVGMGGRIGVESAPGEGATFTLLFPAHAEAHGGEEPVREAEEVSAGGHILLVDDDESVLHVTERALARLGYTVTSCRSGDEAVALFESAPDAFDLILTDQTMPGRTGLQLAGEVRASRPALPIVLTTGYAGLITEEQLRRIGNCTLVMKPATPSQIGRVVRRSMRAATG